MELIVHYILKQQNTTTANLTQANNLVNWGAGVSKNDLFDQLIKLFNSKGRMYGIFANHSKFEAEFLSHSNNNTQPLDLIAFSQESVKRLESIMAKTRLSTGGFIWYLKYQDMKGEDRLMVLVLNNADGFALQLKNGTYEIGSNQHLDLNHLRMGVDINLSAYTQNHDKYIHFKSGGSKETSLYFYDTFVDTKNVYSSARASKDLMEWLLKNVDDIARETQQTSNTVKAKYYEFLEGKSSVSLEELSELLFPGDKNNQNKFIQSANADNISEEIDLDVNVVKKYGELRVRKKGSSLDLKFSSVDVEKKIVEVDKVNKRIIIPDVQKDILDKF